MSSELVQSWRNQILERHQASQRADEELKRAILSKIECVRQTGILISEARGTLDDQQFSQTTDFLSNDAISTYCGFARANKEPGTDLQVGLHSIKAALQMTGAPRILIGSWDSILA
jgi:hypothetical protein